MIDEKNSRRASRTARVAANRIETPRNRSVLISAPVKPDRPGHRRPASAPAPAAAAPAPTAPACGAVHPVRSPAASEDPRGAQSSRYIQAIAEGVGHRHRKRISNSIYAARCPRIGNTDELPQRTGIAR